MGPRTGQHPEVAALRLPIPLLVASWPGACGELSLPLGGASSHLGMLSAPAWGLGAVGVPHSKAASAVGARTAPGAGSLHLAALGVSCLHSLVSPHFLLGARSPPACWGPAPSLPGPSDGLGAASPTWAPRPLRGCLLLPDYRLAAQSIPHWQENNGVEKLFLLSLERVLIRQEQAGLPRFS